MKSIVPVAVMAFTLGCAHVPVEVKTAMQKQAAELKLIREKHQESVDTLFEQVRLLQNQILGDLEKSYQEKYARGPKAVTLDDKTTAVIYTDSAGRNLPPSFNPDRDVIAVSTSRIISDWFRQKRADADAQLEASKQEFLKLSKHVEIAEQINGAVSDYVDSLLAVHRSEKQLGQALANKVSLIPAAAAVQTSLLKLVRFDTRELDNKLPQPK